MLRRSGPVWVLILCLGVVITHASEVRVNEGGRRGGYHAVSTFTAEGRGNRAGNDELGEAENDSPGSGGRRGALVAIGSFALQNLGRGNRAGNDEAQIERSSTLDE